MSHVDEGALHAYLDGALDEYPAAEARRVREHLETCTECARTLAKERRVREEAQDILGLAVPRVEAPTFEELRAYVKAQAPRRSRSSVRLHRLSWAASVVIALGTGWILRGEAPRTGLSSTEPGVAAEAGLTADAAEEAASIGRVASGASELEQASEPAVDGTAARAAAGAPPSGSQQLLDARVPSGTEPLRRESVERLDEASADRAAIPAEPFVEATAVPQVAAMNVADDFADSAAGVAADVADAEPERTQAAQRASEQRLSSAIRQAPASGLGVVAPTLGRGSASDPLDAPPGTSDVETEALSLVVPGLEVLDVLPVGEGTTFAGMRALQRLPSGDTLETAHLPAGVDARALPPLPVGWSEVIRARGSGWLIMRAPLDEASLAELLQRLESGR